MDAYDDSLVEPIELRMIRTARLPIRYPDPKSSPELAGLRDSIKEHGLLQPIVVRPLEHGFEIVAGHRRFAACRSLRWRFIPCKIREITDRQAYEIQITENLQRKTMDPLEEAAAFQKYIVDFGWGGVSELGRRIGRSEEYVSHRMQLLKLPEAVREKVASNDIGVSQAVELASADPSIKEELIDSVVGDGAGRGGATVRQIRMMKGRLREEAGQRAAAPAAPAPAARQNSRGKQIVRKSSLALKVTLSRIDDLIEDAHGAAPGERVELVEFLMGLRRRTHAMIDDTLRYAKSRP